MLDSRKYVKKETPTCSFSLSGAGYSLNVMKAAKKVQDMPPLQVCDKSYNSNFSFMQALQGFVQYFNRLITFNP